MKKIVYICYIFSIFIIGTIQNTHSQPSDPLDSIYGLRLCTYNDNSFLIQEDIPYDIQIKKIIKLSNGCCLISHTIVDGFNITFPIITPVSYKNLKIKKKRSYILYLNRYFLIPSMGFDERGLTVDIMLDGHIITLNDGFFSYWFVSPNIADGHILSNAEYHQKKLFFEQKKENLEIAIKPFLEFISYTNTVIPEDILDTSRIKQTMLSYGESVWSMHNTMGKKIKTKDFLSPKNRFGQPFPTLNDKTTFFDAIKELLKIDYQLPVSSQFHNINIKNVKLIDYSIKNRIWTIQVIWEIAGLDKRYVIILGIKESTLKPLIIGLNRAYYGYHLNSTTSNYKYVPIF